MPSAGTYHEDASLVGRSDSLRPGPASDAASVVVEGDAAPLGSALQPVRVQLLTAFDLLWGTERISLPMAAQRLLAFVALHSRLLQRPYVAGALWLGSTEVHAQASLRSALWRLRHCGPPLIQASRNCIRLAPHVAVDVREQIALARSLLDPREELQDIDYLSALGGELLPDWYDEWVLLEREHVRQLRLHALDALAEKLAEQRRYGEAVEAALAALQSDPLRESSHRVLIMTHLAEGNRCEALRQFHVCEDVLQRKLGVEPASDLVALVRDFLPAWGKPEHPAR